MLISSLVLHSLGDFKKPMILSIEIASSFFSECLKNLSMLIWTPRGLLKCLLIAKGAFYGTLSYSIPEAKEPFNSGDCK